jgi:citrate lyase subunit beta / citryl-CoA lyase
MRSLLIAPADEQRLAEALNSGADAIIVDLAGAAPAERGAARAAAAQFFSAKRRKPGGPMLIVRANALNSGETDPDLDALMTSGPDAILLPGSLGAPSVQQLSAKLAVREAKFALLDGGTRIIAVVETAQSLYHMGSYRGSSTRLIAVAWSSEALRADIGAETDRDRLGEALGPYRLTRDLTLLAATSARVAALDTAFLNVRDLEGLRAEALAALRDGFTGKIALDPAQVGVINDVFPSRSMPLAKGHPPKRRQTFSSS